MKRSKFTEEQIVGLLPEQEAGAKTADVCRRHGVSTATFYAWKAIYGPPPVRKCLCRMFRVVCINLSGLLSGRSCPLALMGSARPCPV